MKQYVKIYERPRDQSMVLISNAIKRRSKTTKVYRGSEDGFNTSVFHKLCDGLAPSLTIIKSEDGRVFGGFTSVPWNLVPGKNGQMMPAAYKKDSDSFIFSFTHQTIHRIMKDKEE
jgi:TLD